MRNFGMAMARAAASAGLGLLTVGCGEVGPAAGPGREDMARREARCPLPDPRIEGQWLQGPATFEHADSGRSHLFKTIPSPSAQAMSGVEAADITAIASIPAVYNVAVTGHAVFALANVTSGHDGTEAFIARLEPASLRTVWRTELPDDRPPGAWRYPGVVAVHANGDIYAAQGPYLYRLDPSDGALRGRTELPTGAADAKDSAYNGFVALPGGMLVSKSHHRPSGCTTDGFRAFLDCGVEGAPASVLAVIDPETMKVVSKAGAPELIGGRITATRFGGRDYVYAPGVESVHRFEWTDGGLSYDDVWSPANYREGRETPATAVAALGGFVILQTNALPTAEPTRIIALSQNDPDERFELTPFPDTTTSMIPSMPSVDTRNGRVFVTDGWAGRTAGLAFDPATGFTLEWAVPGGSFSFSALIGPRDDRVLVTSEAIENDGFDYESERLVWRDASSGQELLRGPVFARLGGTVIAPGCGGRIYAPAARAGKLYALDFLPR
mgnify:CR=1 FL=1